MSLWTTVADLRDEVLRLYRDGPPQPASTGWHNLDRLYRVMPGELTIVTGIPGSGKSNFLDAMLVNIADSEGWRFGYVSPENYPISMHMASLAEKWTEMPYTDGPTPRMTPLDLTEALTWIEAHFTWLTPEDEPANLPRSLLTVLTLAEKLHQTTPLNGLVIDPWNEMESIRPERMTETEYIGQSLTRLRIFARRLRIHVWVVVHPAKLERTSDNRYPVPSLYDCSGSANWRNKADNGIVVWRELGQTDTPEVQIHIQKIRFRHTGKRGMAVLRYQPVTATYQPGEA